MFVITIILFVVLIYFASAINLMSIPESIESIEKKQNKRHMEEKFRSLANELEADTNIPKFLNLSISNPFDESKGIFAPLLLNTGSEFYCFAAEDIVEKLELTYVGRCDVMCGNASVILPKTIIRVLIGEFSFNTFACVHHDKLIAPKSIAVKLVNIWYKQASGTGNAQFWRKEDIYKD